MRGCAHGHDYLKRGRVGPYIDAPLIMKLTLSAPIIEGLVIEPPSSVVIIALFGAVCLSVIRSVQSEVAVVEKP
jgi:hypothetical protein